MLYQTTIPILDKLQGLSARGGFVVIDDLGNYVSNIVGLLLTVAGIAFLIYLIFGGITWLLAGGDKNNVESARSRITNAVIGLTVVAAAWAIFLLINHFFGLNLTTP